MEIIGFSLLILRVLVQPKGSCAVLKLCKYKSYIRIKVSFFYLFITAKNSILIMSVHEVKDNVENLLNILLRRFHKINQQSGVKNLLEIDLAMEEIRTLYIHMEKLRDYTAVESLSSSSREINIPMTLTGQKPETPEDSSRPGTTNKEEPRPEPEQPASPPAAPVFAETTRPAEPVSQSRNQEEVVAKHEEKKEAEQPPKQEQEKSSEPAEEPKAASEPVRQPDPVKPAPPVTTPPVEVTGAGKPGPVSGSDDRKKSIGERFIAQEKSASVHERLAKIRDDKSIGMRMQQKPVTNIKDAIGLNERFLFINELFAGDINAYNQAVQDLNSKSSIHEAFELLNQLTTRYQWDGQRSAETIDKFANTVQRRYM
jgi:hypothetical protein